MSRQLAPGPVYVLNTNTERETGRKAQLSNIEAAKTVADVIRTCLGPQSMLKMVLDPMGGIVMTNDGNAILREIEVVHPAAKSMLEMCRAQDEEVGDGTTSVVILAGEVLACVAPFLEPGRKLHPCVIISGMRHALRDALSVLGSIARPLDATSDEALLRMLASTVVPTLPQAALVCRMAVSAVRMVAGARAGAPLPEGLRPEDIDIKQYAKVEKVPGGELVECAVLDGVMFNKDVVHPGMRRRVERPRILLIDCPLEYKKGESQTAMEISREGDWQAALEAEETQVAAAVAHIVALRPDVVISEKGISDLAQHHLVRANIAAIRRVRKSDNNRIARAVGATVVNRLEDAREADVGTGCGLFEIRKIADEYYTFLTACAAPRACTMLLRGPSKDILGEVERNLQDAMCAVRNALLDPRLVPGGGAAEAAMAAGLERRARAIEGVERGPYRAVAQALAVIPRTLVQNAGGEPVRVLADLHARHMDDAAPSSSWGVDGFSGSLVDMAAAPGGGVWEALAVKAQTVKTAVESACMLLRVDDIVAGVGKPGASSGGPAMHAPEE